MEKSTEHREGKAQVKVIYYTSKTYADGSHPFMLRITKNRKRKYISTGLSLHPDDWDTERATFRKSYPKDKRDAINASIKKWESKYADAAIELADADEQHDAYSVALKVSEVRQTERQFRLLSYFDEIISQFEQMGDTGNRKVYKDVKNKLQKFIGEREDISFSQVTVKFCNDWERQMKSEGLKETTISLKFRTLRSVLNKAIANGYAKASNYPFARHTAEIHKFSVGKFDLKTKKRAINKVYINRLEEYLPPCDMGKYASLRHTEKRFTLAKHLFLFSYYCGGINFVDMANLSWSNIVLDNEKKYRIEYTRKKSKKIVTLLLVKPAMEIINYYKQDNDTKNNYIFPILNRVLHKSTTQIENRCNKILGQVNSDLKVIGDSISSPVPLTSYVARHTFGSVLKQAGVSTAVISDLYKHSDEKTTQIYLSEFDTDAVDAALDYL